MALRTPEEIAAAEAAYDASRLSRAPAENTKLVIEILEAICGPEESARERVDALMATHDELPSPELLFSLLLEDSAAHFLWWRAVDWVLWRQHNGLQVERLSSEDAYPAALNARFNAARDLSEQPGSWARSDTLGSEISVGNVITDWERTPEQRAELTRELEIFSRALGILNRPPAGAC